jgi:hypothetical protein
MNGPPPFQLPSVSHAASAPGTRLFRAVHLQQINLSLLLCSNCFVFLACRKMNVLNHVSSRDHFASFQSFLRGIQELVAQHSRAFCAVFEDILHFDVNLGPSHDMHSQGMLPKP